jgi:hypothetical protein
VHLFVAMQMLCVTTWFKFKIGVGGRLMSKSVLLLFAVLVGVSSASFSGPAEIVENQIVEGETEFDPFAPEAMETIREFDQAIEEHTGESPFLSIAESFFQGCYRSDCPVYVYVSISEQKLYLYLDGHLQDTWLVSTGVPGRGTPDLDRRPNGRIYDRYNSKKWPGGDYKGLGNMPYAVFIAGGIALHGTPASNWSKLGRKASHGCIRQHPDNAKYLNRLIRQNGIKNVWITIR